ncbi:S41 family peptidase [Paenibacillus phoenicis]|uniref:S41 family peptidase n=1 Tax=Paenibacillus phoenicis TaxID=554117 RepID=A0ABU5PHA2_9BACL|nr:S41 family peptidase [Paenibacillus phoenicis]MEA3569325.1 S41 family peptidase [Paenibacillus phoenicis]
MVKNHGKAHASSSVNPFNGHLYLLISPKTFSAANVFAVTFKDNGLATLIGEPTGNQPSCYGDIFVFKMPHSGFQFTVSYKHFSRPDQRLTHETPLEPDIYVPTTRQDIIGGRDAQMEKLMEIITAAK